MKPTRPETVTTSKGKTYTLRFPYQTPRGTIPYTLKARALAKFYVEHVPLHDVIEEVYSELKLRLPANPYQALYNWRRQLTNLIASGRAPHDLIELCTELGLIITDDRHPPDPDAEPEEDEDGGS